MGKEFIFYSGYTLCFFITNKNSFVAHICDTLLNLNLEIWLVFEIDSYRYSKQLSYFTQNLVMYRIWLSIYCTYNYINTVYLYKNGKHYYF